jgi:hypothetical protein
MPLSPRVTKLIHYMGYLRAIPLIVVGIGLLVLMAMPFVVLIA